jgi:hypothetical protein
MSKYQEQYCKKHNQHYADFLHECPICAGEKMVKPPVEILLKDESMEDKGV